MAKQRDENFLRSLGRRIAMLRKEAGLSQEKLAEKVEVHRTYIGLVEQGKRNPTADTLNRIARTFGLTFEQLFEKPLDLSGMVMEERPKDKTP